MNAKVSIVIPVYKAKDTIDRCVSSLLEGTYRNIEVILVEDCSEDGTYEVCKGLESRYAQVICIQNEKNHGVSYTRNQGLKKATGTYLMFVDSDDWVEPDFVEKMAPLCKEDETCMPICGYVNHDEKKNGRTDLFLWSQEQKIETVPVKDTIVKLYEKRMLQIIWNKVFLVKTIKENQIKFDEHICIGEDFRFLLDYMKCQKIEQFKFLNLPLYHYSRDNENSLMSRLLEIGIEEPMKNFRKMYEFTKKSPEEIERLLEKEYEKQLEYYAYLIVHDRHLSKAEKREKVQALSNDKAEELYRKHRKLFYKEKIMKIMRRY